MRQKQASRSLAETATKGRATLVAYKNRSLQSVNEESWPREQSECFGSFEPVFNDISLSVIVLTQPDLVSHLATNQPLPKAPRHGGNRRAFCQRHGFTDAQILDLSTGISPWSWPVANVPQKVWQDLPCETSDLYRAASAYYQCPDNNLLPVAGSQAAIEALPRTAIAASEVLVPELGYAEHAYRWQQSGHKVRTYISLQDLQWQLEKSDARYAVVINPNNPTTVQYSAEQLLPLANTLSERGGLLVVDEAFMDAIPEQSLAPYASEYSLVVLRSIGKFFGLAGVRLGFVCAADDLIVRLKMETGLWSVSHIAIWLGSRMLVDAHWIEQQKQRLAHRADKMAGVLRTKIPDLAWKKSTSFISGFGSEQQVARLENFFAEAGIMVRIFDQPISSTNQHIIRLGFADDQGLSRIQQVL